MAKRRKKKNTKPQKIRFGKFLLAMSRQVLRAVPVLVFTFLGAIVFLSVRKSLYADAVLSVRDIVVQPSGALSDGERRILESLALGKNMFRLDLRRISKTLEKNPLILDARVSRELPSTLKVQFIQRVPIAYVQTTQKGGFGLVSEDGVILDIFPKPESPLVLIEAFTSGVREFSIGSRVSVKGFAEAVPFIKAYWERPLARAEALVKISLDHLGNLTMTLGAGPPVHLGRNPLERLSALDQLVPLLAEEDRSNIEYVDLQFGHVIVKRKR